jgi:RNA polymerase sigma-B factor
MLRSGLPGPPRRSDCDREELLRRYARRRHPRDLEQLVLFYTPLARRLARRYATASSGRDDLEQVATEGLIKALQRYQPERGFAFASFAVPTILGQLRRYQRDTAWPAHVPRALQERVRAVRAAADRLSAARGRSPTARELAEEMGCAEEQVIEALCAASSLNVVPLEGPPQSDEGAVPSVADRLGAEDPNFERVECLSAIESATPALTPTQKRVLRLHFHASLSQRQIAAHLGVSRWEVARALDDALTQLRTETRQGHAA